MSARTKFHCILVFDEELRAVAREFRAYDAAKEAEDDEAASNALVGVIRLASKAVHHLIPEEADGKPVLILPMPTATGAEGERDGQ